MVIDCHPSVFRDMSYGAKEVSLDDSKMACAVATLFPRLNYLISYQQNHAAAMRINQAAYPIIASFLPGFALAYKNSGGSIKHG